MNGGRRGGVEVRESLAGVGGPRCGAAPAVWNFTQRVDGQVPQKLLGPSAFPLDRLFAILGSLMEEHDQDVPILNPAHMDDAGDDYELEKDTEVAVGQIQVSATVWLFFLCYLQS